jgi:hypothetical protein
MPVSAALSATFRKIAAGICGVIAGIAGVMFLFAPLPSSNGILACNIALACGVFCFMIYASLDDE